MPKRKALEPEPELPRHMDDPEQYQRFVEAAQELGADSPEAGAAFERALQRVLSHRAPNGPTPKREPGRKPKREQSRHKIPK